MKDKIIKLANMGLTPQQIADDLDCSLVYVCMAIKEINSEV